jgi:hypothetical protein
MCCLSEASSHFVVFVCENPDRKPSRKMKRRTDSPISQKNMIQPAKRLETVQEYYFSRKLKEVAAMNAQ